MARGLQTRRFEEQDMRVNAACEAAAWRRSRANARSAPFLEADEERCLLARAAHDPNAMSILVASHMRLVLGIAQHYVRDGISADDLIGEGTLGLLEAIRRFDGAVDTRLSTYAKWWIRARIRAYSLANRRLVALPSTRAARVALARLAVTERDLAQTIGRTPTRDELAEALGVPQDELDSVVQAVGAHDLHIASDDDALSSDPPDSGVTPEQAFAEAEQQNHVARALEQTFDELSLRQRYVFEAQFAHEEHTGHCELAKALGVSRQRVSQIALGVRDRLHKNLRDGLAPKRERVSAPAAT